MIVNSATSTVTIEKLRAMFATHGLPETLVSDNGSVFVSVEFQEFLRRNSIKHIRIAPYHPASNGQAERAMQTFKNGMKRSTKDTLETRVSRFLFQYRITPNTTTGISPAELMMGRQLRSHMHLLHPELAEQVSISQQRQQLNHDKRAKDRKFSIRDRIYSKDFPAGLSWLFGTIKEKRGLMLFLIELEDGRIVRQHVDHICHCYEESDLSTEDLEEIELPIDLDSGSIPDTSPTCLTGPAEEQPPLRRSTRLRQPPDRFSPDPNMK